VYHQRRIRAVPKSRVLVVDDEAIVRLGIRRFLEANGFEVREASSAGETESEFRTSPPDVAILDHRLPDGHGVDLIPRLKEAAPNVPLIVLSAHGSIDLAVRAIKEGAEQFLVKPVELPALHVLVQRVLEAQRQRQKQLAGRSRQARESVDPFQGRSPAIKRLAAEVAKLLPSESPVLIEGETGTGKGVLARWLHQQGPRAEEAFVDLNCAGLSRELLESELFGHERGAFTGSTATKLGLLEVAHRGTLFLDEIGDLDLLVQPKLLTALEEKRFRRLGDVRDRHSSFRLIAATHHDLERQVREGRFRGDLYFRISTIPLRVPALHERREDIPLLARAFLARLSAELGRSEAALSPGVEQVLAEHRWPGNIRELRNVLERALLVSEGDEIRVEDLSFAARIALPQAPPATASTGAPPSTPFSLEESLNLEQLERQAIARAMAVESGHVGRAAARLGIPRSSLYKKLKQLGPASR
jgi:DNA-binding NtrC family response regulator